MKMEEKKACLSISSWLNDIQIKSYYLSEIPEDERTEKMCFVAIHYWGGALEYVPEKYKTYELCLDAVRHNTPVDESCSALAFVPENLKTYEMCLEAVNHDYLISIFWDEDDEGCFTVECYRSAINFVPKKFRTPELCYQSLIHHPSSISGLFHFIETQINTPHLSAGFVQPKKLSDILNSPDLFLKALNRIGMPEEYNERALDYLETIKEKK